MKVYSCIMRAIISTEHSYEKIAYDNTKEAQGKKINSSNDRASYMRDTTLQSQ